jgi:hypothetical protein
VLLVWVVVYAVFLMHAGTPGGGCPDADGVSAASMPGHVRMPDMSGPALVEATPVHGAGQMCASLPARPWLFAVLALLLLAAGAWRRPRVGAPTAWWRQPGLRAPPSPSPLLTRICVSRT